MADPVSGSAWRGRPVLVTGVTGFVGSALAARLAAEGARVVGLVRDEVPGSQYRRLGLDRGITVVHGCVEDRLLLERAVNDYEVQVVYHLAAQALVGAAGRAPVATFKANIEGTWNLLEACRAIGCVTAVVLASSDKAYGPQRDLPYREDTRLDPGHPYDVSKACADLLGLAYARTYGLPVTVARPANIYGPGDLHPSRLVPDAIRSALDGRAPVLRSDGTPERDFLYVDDAVDFYLLLAERIPEARGEAFNAGSGQPVRVLDVVRTILRLCGRADLAPEVRGSGTPHGEIDRQWLDASKAKRCLGWAPVVPLEEGLRRTIAWHRALPAPGAR